MNGREDRREGTIDALDALAAAYWDMHLEAHPLFATAIGEHRFDDRLPDITPGEIAARRGQLADLRRRVDGLDATALDGEAGITRAALGEAIDFDRAELDSGLPDWNVDPLEGLPAMLLEVPAYQRLQTPDDGRAMVARWRRMAGHVDAHVANLRRSLSEGRVCCRAPGDRTAAMLEGLLRVDCGTWPLLAPLAMLGRLEAWTAAERGHFASDLRAAVEGEVRPAFARLHEALTSEILPAARSPERPGMCHVEGGADGYRRLVRAHTSLDLEPEALHRTGLAEIERIDVELGDLAGRTLGARSLPEALAALRSDPALHFATRDEVHATASASLARATAAIPGWFGRLPQAPCEVVRMEPHEEPHSTIAYYRQPAADGSRPGQYYVNTSAPETRPRYEAEVLAYHEAIPGHHLQIAIGQELPRLPEFRRHLGPTAFFEGWGLYTERLADEMGLYSGDLDRIGVLSFDAWRAARLVVDTGMHALGWTRERAVEYMHDHTALAPNNIANEVDRYIAVPGQALAYKTGQLEILRLRHEAEQRLGEAFDIRGFHDAVLGSGALALVTLRHVVEGWVADRAART